ncbi:MAG TPA: choice-of-anchor B family protein, partial [Phaeodactylibacter sp.]|nr:choice-of-anchor B family protein [Phaeodactylibacter sp.]
NMELLGQYNDATLPDGGNSQKKYNDIWGYAANGREYALVGNAAYVLFVDVTSPTSPVLIDQIAGGDTTIWRDMKTYENYAYSISDNTEEGMMIFDLSDLPNTVSKIAQTSDFFEEAHNIFVDEPNARIYVTGANTLQNGLIVLDISNPLEPVMIGNDTLLGGYVHDVYVKDNIAYCSHGYNGFFVWDYTVADEPVLLASLSTNGYNHSSWVSEDGSYAIFAEEVPQGLPLGVADLTTLPNGFMEVESYFQFPLITNDVKKNTPHNPFIRGNYAIVSYYEDGVQVIDLSDISNPVLAGYYDTFPNNTNYAEYFGCWGVYPFLPSGNIIASDRKYGLHILKFDEDAATATDNFTSKDISIFPNPSDGTFNILMNKNNSESNSIIFEVSDLSGKITHHQVLNKNADVVDLSFLPNGFYFGKIIMGEKEVVKKLVIGY